MSDNNQINLRSGHPGEGGGKPPRNERGEAPLTDVMQEGIAFQLLQGLGRIERQLASIEGRLAGGGQGTARRVVSEKPNLRNMLMGLMHKGWLSEAEAIERTGWQTIGVRSFVTKLRSLGLSVEEEDRDGTRFYRIMK